MSWTQTTQQYFAALFGSGPEYEVADVPGEILKLRAELRALRESAAHHQRRIAALQRTPPPNAYAGADVHASAIDPTPLPPPPAVNAQLKDLHRLACGTRQQIQHHLLRMRLLRMRANRTWYFAGLFLFLYLLYLLLRGSARERARRAATEAAEAEAEAET